MHDVDEGLVGRDAELTRLRDAIAAASEGRPTFLLVTGEAGIGKTRLLHAAVAMADRAGVRTLWGTAIESGRSVPYLPLIAPLRAIAGEVGAGTYGRSTAPDESAAALRRALVGGVALPADDAAQGASLDTARLMEATFDVLARGPTLLVVDDVQWADASTLTVLDYLAHRATGVPLLVLAAARDEEPATLARLPIAVGRQFERLALPRLSEREVGRQAAVVLGTVVPADRVASLFRRTAGNPFFVEQVLAQGAADGAPASLRALVLRRIAALDGETRRVLEALAIIGRPSVPDRIARVAGCVSAAVEAALETAAAAGVVVTDEAGIMLRHPLFSEVIERELSGPGRRRLHAAAATAESEAPGGADVAVIANHW